MRLEPAEVYPLCDFLNEELTTRGWTIKDLAKAADMEESQAEYILNGGKINSVEASKLANGFGVSPQLFLNLQMAWERRI